MTHAEVRTLAEAAVAAAAKAESMDAINWGDLSVVEVSRCVRDDGDIWWHVLIEEASPSSAIFQAFVQRHMKEAGFIGELRIETAW